MARRPWELSRDQLTTLVAVVILFTWTVSFFAGLVSDDYEPPAVLTPLMTLVAGFCFSDGLISRRKATKEADQ